MIHLIFLQIVLPLALLGWLGRGRAASRIGWLLRAVIVAAYLVTTAVAGLWLALPRFVLWILLAAYPVAATLGWRRVRAGDGTGGWLLFRLGGLYALALLMLITMGLAIFGRTPPPGPTVDLPLPLRGGTWYVANGGSSRILNAHLGIPAEAQDRYRGQLLGVDLVRVDRLGRRARGFMPSDPAAYGSFGETVVAPCDGRVVAARGDLPDLSPPTPDREHMAGNHVLLECALPLEEGDGRANGDSAPVWILLAHLREGSVRVRAGEAVEAGQAVGAVGNTGNSGEPHLHVHAQRPGTEAALLGGEPIPLRLDGRYLARNQRIAARGATGG